MPATIETMGINRLSVKEKLTLVHDIWDSIATDVESESLSDGQKQEIDRRLAKHELNPDAAIPWEQVEAEALARLRK